MRDCGTGSEAKLCCGSGAFHRPNTFGDTDVGNFAVVAATARNAAPVLTTGALGVVTLRSFMAALHNIRRCATRECEV